MILQGDYLINKNACAQYPGSDSLQHFKRVDRQEEGNDWFSEGELHYNIPTYVKRISTRAFLDGSGHKQQTTTIKEVCYCYLLLARLLMGGPPTSFFEMTRA